MSGYDDDVLEWSEHQATLLRHLAAGERLPANDIPDRPRTTCFATDHNPGHSACPLAPPP